MKLLLCDAVIIIDAYPTGTWKILKSNYRIHIASTVLEETQYFKDDLHVKYYIDLKKDIASRKIMKISIPIEEIQAVIKKTCEKRLNIHAGEAESIAALLKPEYHKLYFCTADKVAIAAAQVYDVMSRIVSFEKYLEGFKTRKLPYKLTEKAMQLWKAEAIQRIE